MIDYEAMDGDHSLECRARRHDACYVAECKCDCHPRPPIERYSFAIKSALSWVKEVIG